MATILPFAKPEGRVRKPGRSAGEIVFFPGVRVEYHEEPLAPTGSDKPRRGTRRSRSKDALSA